MKDILQELSPSAVGQALDANKIAYHTLFSALPGAELHADPDVLWFETGVPLGLFNGVLQTHIEQDALSASIDRILAHFQRRKLPFEWSLGPSSQPTGFGELLQARGILHDEDEPGMAVDVLALNEDIQLSSSLTIVPVTTIGLLDQWSRVWGCGAPDWVAQYLFSVYSDLDIGPHSALRLYLGLLDDKPVATVALFLAGGVASINHVVTIHEARRQGIGAAMTLMAAREARHQGYRIAVLTASPMGITVYRRLGFREYCTFSSYEWSPDEDNK